jgi:membrane associated rhomboid family serine protease
MRSKQYPIATISVLLATALLTGLQFAFPQIVSLLERTPIGIRKNQWWRLITPLFVHPEGWHQIAFNFPSILLLGVLVERLLGAATKRYMVRMPALRAETEGRCW